MKFRVSLKAVCFAPGENCVIATFSDRWGRKLTIIASFGCQIEQVKATIDWPDLVDFLVAKADKELELQGRPPAAEGAPREGCCSPEVVYETTADYRDLTLLWTGIGGQMTTDFFPEETITLFCNV